MEIKHTAHTEDRSRVLHDLQVNMVVEAGAGTGKTTLLITRICLAVLAQGIPIEKIVALTFTEKAAAEIKNRLVTALHQVVRDVSGEGIAGPESLYIRLARDFSLSKEEILARAQTALLRLDRASLGTIHGFCADILKTFPLEAGLSPQAEIDTGSKAVRLFEARWNAFLDEELGLQAPRKNVWKEVLTEISLDSLKIFAQTLCSGKIEHYDYFSHASLVARVCEEKAVLARTWSTAFLDAKKPVARNAEKALSWAADTLTRAVAFLRGQEIPAPPDTDQPPALAAVAPKGWEEETYEQARELVQFACKVQPEKQHIFRLALGLVQDFAAQLRAEYTREGILSFDDLIVKTRNLVRDDLYVRRLLKEKIDVLFIDEFQDTDPVQGELLLFLAEEKSASALRWQDVHLAAGKLVVVGDPKQSIYRFRGADITAYELFTQLILSQGGVKCFLRNNYRSVPDIVQVANAVCRRAMTEQTSFQPAYEPIYPTRSGGKGAVEWLFVKAPADATATADDFRQNQAQAVAQWINEHVGKMTLSNGEKLAYQDIVILSRVRTSFSLYTDALRRHGIPFQADSEKDFFKRQEINDFLNFLRVVADPSDRTALVGVLRSPLGGFNDEEIYRFSQNGELNVQATVSHPGLARLYALVLSFAEKVGRCSVQELADQVLEKTFLPQACAVAYDGEQTVEILNRLVQTVLQMLGEGPASLGSFLAGAQDLLERTPQDLNTAPVEAAQAVTVMSVHKSKGLDFPVVILVDLSKKGGANPTDKTDFIFSWQYNMYGLRVGKICDANLAFLEEEQRKHERCEEIRTLYVALTRAKDRMVLVADQRTGAEKSAAAFKQAGLLPDGVACQVGDAEVQVPVTYIPYDKPEHFIYRHVTAAVQSSALPALENWRDRFAARQARYEALRAEQALSPSARTEISGENATVSRAALLGTICHRALQLRFTESEKSAAQIVSQAAQEAGQPALETEAAALLDVFYRTDTFARLQTYKLLAAEMPFSFLTPEERVETGVIDAVFERPDGGIEVVDYKTDHIPASGAPALLEKYRAQLTVYRQAAQKIFPSKQIVTSLVLVRTGECAEL